MYQLPSSIRASLLAGRACLAKCQKGLFFSLLSLIIRERVEKFLGRCGYGADDARRSRWPLSTPRAPRRKKKDGPVPVTGRAAGAAAASMPNAMPWRRIPFWTTELDRAVRQSSTQCSRARSPARNLLICPIRQADGSTVADPPAGTDNSRKVRLLPHRNSAVNGRHKARRGWLGR